MEHRPTLCIIAGPNGSGKTTTTTQLLANEWGADSLYINPDNIAQNEFGDWNNEESVMKAAKRASEMRYQCLEEKKSFVFETVLSSQEKIEFIMKAREAGFFIRVFFICTENPKINAARIAQRYLNGGHEVPISKIVSRYFKSIQNMRYAISIVDRAYIYDNSTDGQLPSLLFRTANGKLTKIYADTIPQWASVLIH